MYKPPCGDADEKIKPCRAIHFSLFIRACIETQRRNKEPPAPMMYPQPMWPAPYGSSHPYGVPYGGDPQRGPASKEMNYA